MLRVSLDTNVLLDLTLRREPWLSEAQAMWDARAMRIRSFATFPPRRSPISTMISRKQIGNTQARDVLHYCLANFEICAVNRLIVEFALTLPGNDVEDNVIISCALNEALDLIVTRNVSDFKHSPIQAVKPPDVLKHLTP